MYMYTNRFNHISILHTCTCTQIDLIIYLYYIHVHVILPQIESIINHTCLFPCYILVHEIQLIFLTSQEQDTQEYLINLFNGWMDI